MNRRVRSVNGVRGTCRGLLVWLIGLHVALTSWLSVAQNSTPSPDADSETLPAKERRLVQRLEQAKRLLVPADGDAKPDAIQAVRLLQSILDDGLESESRIEGEDVLLDDNPDQLASGPTLKSETRRLLAQLPPEARQHYELQFGKQAEARLDAAVQKGDWLEIEEIARRWSVSTAGIQATWSLALRAFDQGRALEAARRFDELRLLPAARAAHEPDLSLRSALAWKIAGQPDRCVQVLQELKTAWNARPLSLERGGELPWFDQPTEALSWLDRWAGSAIRPARLVSARRHEWPLAFGGPSRNHVAGEAVPTESPQWSRALLPADRDDEPDASTSQLPSTSRSTDPMKSLLAAARVELRASIEQRLQAGRPVLPVAQPIVVADTVIVRKLSDLQAFRLSDGRWLWSSAAIDTPIEEQLAELPRQRTPRPMRSDLQSLVQERTWNDVGSASLSSDGTRVFCLQHRGMGPVMMPQLRWRGMFVPQESNVLVAIEAATGRLLWEIGGPHSEQESSEAGAFFLGSPLPWNDELFVLSDDGLEIRLLVLDPRDGRLRWSQTLAVSDPIWSGVTRDAGLSPTVAGGLVICPTGSGSLVAIDPLRRELRWSLTYREPSDRIPRRRFDFQAPHLIAESLWQQSVVLASGNRLLMAAPDHSELLCLEADSGKLLWKQPRGDALFLAGLTLRADSQVANSTEPLLLIAGHGDIHAVRVSNGEPAWRQPAQIGPLLGRGVLIEGVLHQPVSQNGGEVVSVETQAGRVLARTPVSRGLGNLIAVNGQIVSQSAMQLAAFPALSELQGRLAKSLAVDPDDAQALERQGRIRLQLGQRDRGRDDLRRAVAHGASAAAKHTLAALLLEDLRQDRSTDIEATIRELESLIEDPKQRLQFARLRVHGLQQRGDLLLAARELLKLADSWEQTSDLEPFGNGAARTDRWTAARLAELHEALPATDRARLDEEIATRLRAATESTGTASLRNFLMLFGWSDSAILARLTLLDRLGEKRHRHQFESLLHAIRRDGPKAQRALATARLARHWLSLEQIELARPLIDELGSSLADVVALEAKTGRELATAWRSEFRERLVSEWPRDAWRVERVSNAEPIERTYPVDWSAPPDRFHESWSLLLDGMRRHLIARDSAGREAWRFKLPLDEHSIAQANGNSAAWFGRWLVLNLGDRFLVLDTIATVGSSDRSPHVLWQAALFDPRLEVTVTPLPVQQVAPIEGTPTRYVMTDTSGRRLGRVAILSDEVICFQVGSRLFAAELASGDLLWSVDGLPAGCELSGDHRAVVAIPPDRKEWFVFSTLDGRQRTRHDAGPATVLTTCGRNVLTRTITDDSQQLRLVDTWTERLLLDEQLTAAARPTLSVRDSLGVLEPAGRFRIWSLADGSRELEQTVPALNHLSHIVVMRDRERWLLLTSLEEPVANPRLKPRVSELYFDHWRLHGPAFAFDRATGRQLWSEQLDWQGVNLSQPSDSPLLLLAARVYIPKETPEPVREGYRLRIELLDKQTGKRHLVSEEPALTSLSYCEQRPNLREKSLDIAIDRVLHKVTFDTPAK